MDVADSILDLVGNTPLVRLARLIAAEALTCDLVAKVEMVNPGGSVKDRVAIAMIDAAEASAGAATGRHDRRTDVGQHGCRSRDRRRAARLPLHLRDERQDERREDRAAALVRRRGRRVPDRGSARGSAVVLLDRGTTRARDAGRVPARPVLEPGEPARARAHDRTRDLAADRRQGHALRRRHRHRRHDHRCRAVPEGAEPDRADRRCRPVGLGVLGRHRPPVSRRGRRRRLLADDLRPVARRPRDRGQRRRLLPHRAARDAARGTADRRFVRHRGARRARGRARRSGPDDSRRRAVARLGPQLPLEDLRRRVDVRHGLPARRGNRRRRRARREGRRPARPRAHRARRVGARRDHADARHRGVAARRQRHEGAAARGQGGRRHGARARADGSCLSATATCSTARSATS